MVGGGLDDSALGNEGNCKVEVVLISQPQRRGLHVPSSHPVSVAFYETRRLVRGRGSRSSDGSWLFVLEPYAWLRSN